MNVRKLTKNDAKFIADVEEQIYPDNMLLGANDYAIDLSRALQNFSYGIFDKDKLIGYIVSYVLPEDDCIYISDLAILEPYRNNLRLLMRLLRPFVSDVRKTNYMIYADCTTMSAAMFKTTLQKYGYVVREIFYDSCDDTYTLTATKEECAHEIL